MFIYACKHKLGAYSRMSLIIQKHNIDINKIILALVV